MSLKSKHEVMGAMSALAMLSAAASAMPTTMQIHPGLPADLPYWPYAPSKGHGKTRGRADGGSKGKHVTKRRSANKRAAQSRKRNR